MGLSWTSFAELPIRMSLLQETVPCSRLRIARYAWNPSRTPSIRVFRPQMRLSGSLANTKPVPWFWSDQYNVKLQSAGLALEYDRVMSVQSGRADGVAFWYFRDGNAVAVDTINDARTHMAARRLFGAGVKLTPELLVDPRFDLMHYIRVATSCVPEGSGSALERVP